MKLEASQLTYTMQALKDFSISSYWKPLKHFNQESGMIRIIFLKDHFEYNVNNAFEDNGRVESGR